MLFINFISRKRATNYAEKKLNELHFSNLVKKESGFSVYIYMNFNMDIVMPCTIVVTVVVVTV